MSGKNLLGPLVLSVGLALLAGLVDRGESTLRAEQPRRRSRSSRASSRPEKSKRARAEKRTEPAPAPKLRRGTEAILEALEEPASLNYVETPLRDVIDDLQARQAVHTFLDQRALDEVGIPADTPITFSLSDVPFRSALELMLGSLDLTWTIASDVLLITTPEEAEMMLITKPYDASDLLVTIDDHAYEGNGLPTTSPREEWFGFNQVPHSIGEPSATQPPGFICGTSDLMWRQAYCGTMDDTIDLIQSVIAPDSWDEVGGPGTCTAYGRLLVVSQTLPIQLQIEAFLEAMRAERQGVPSVAVDARWLLLDSDLLDQLLDGRKSRPADAARITVDPETLDLIKRAVPGVDSDLLDQLLDARKSRPADAARITVDPETLDLLTRTVPSGRARITCISGQKVYLVAGDRRSVVHGAIPVVGSGIGYQPVVKIPNVGVLLEIRPSIVPGTDSAVLDVETTVTGWRQPDLALRVGTHFPPSRFEDTFTQETTDVPGGETSVNVDRVNMPTQQFAATTRVPLGKPVLLGGLTLSPTTEDESRQAGEERKQLYLVVQTSRAADDR